MILDSERNDKAIANFTMTTISFILQCTTYRLLRSYTYVHSFSCSKFYCAAFFSNAFKRGRKKTAKNSLLYYENNIIFLYYRVLKFSPNILYNFALHIRT